MEGAKFNKGSRSQARHGRLTILIVLACFGALFFFCIGYVAEEQPTADVVKKDSKIENDVVIEDYTKAPTAAPTKLNVCPDLCEKRRAARVKKLGVDHMDRKALVEAAHKAKEDVLAKLHADYGKQTFEDIFVDKEASGSEQRYRGKVDAHEDGKSIEILKKKLMMKVLSMQLSLAKKDSESIRCDCLNGEIPLGEMLDSAVEDLPIDPTYERYVWATGGHSASAGHGNMYNESYTAFMGRDLKPFFASLGIDFDARNYAMGGTGSAFEVSTCYEQIYGSDVDFFSWDFGMTDGDERAKLIHYAYKGLLSPGRPVFMGNQIGNRGETFQLLAELGAPVFITPDNIGKEMKEKIPDCSGLSDAQIAAMPPYVRNLKCEGKLESGDPYCGQEKYTKYYCEKRAKRTSWHPGFKVHAMDGRVMSLFLMQSLIDALKELSEHEVKDPATLLAQLKTEDDKRHQAFANSPIPLPMKNNFWNATWDAENAEFLNWIYRGRSMCRTGRLPARTRFLGYMTNTGKTGDIAPLGNETYDTGIEMKEAIATPSQELRLVYEYDGFRDRNWQCTEQILAPDYRDFYYAHSNDGWTKIKFPNDKEKAAYRYDKSQFKGILALHLVMCPWGHCPEGELRGKALAADQMEMTVNGKKVSSFMIFKHGDHMFLVGEQGFNWEPSSNDDYEIAVRLKEPNSFLRISSIMLY